ncbi:MAG: lysophospholipid acyltransferase family protein [Candidatus Campbellbacteria bacterium]|nr:lysophospholipid acyltransferase family protein [Candidatus Campbellbacteria bacterium]
MKFLYSVFLLIGGYLTVVIQYLVRLTSRPLFILFLRLEVRGTENIPKDGQVIFATNHTSKFDPFLLQTSLPLFSRHIPLFFVTREKRFYTSGIIEKLLYGGWFFRLIGGYPAYEGKKDYAYSLREHIKILESGRSTCIFPEGGLAKNGHEGKYRGGVGYLSYAANTPVLPVYIKGIENITFIKFLLRRRKVRIRIGEPLHFGYENNEENDQPGVFAFKDFARKVVEGIYKEKI